VAFETLEIAQKEPPTAKISYLRGGGARSPKPGKPAKNLDGVKPKLKISIPTTICGTAKAKIFELQLGSGNDAGKIRISGCKSGNAKGIEPAELKHAFTFNFGYVPKLGDDIFEDRRPVRKITEDVYEIDVPPSWFMPNAKND